MNTNTGQCERGRGDGSHKPHHIHNMKKDNEENIREMKRKYTETISFIDNMDYKSAIYAYSNMMKQRFVGALLDKGARVPREIDTSLYY